MKKVKARQPFDDDERIVLSKKEKQAQKERKRKRNLSNAFRAKNLDVILQFEEND